MTIPIVAPTPAPGSFVEKRAASTIGSTNEVLPGTLVNVPSANSSGYVPDKPVVAVNTTSRWTDPQFLIGLLTCLSGVVTTVIGVLPQSGPIDWRATGPTLALAVIGAILSFLRQRTNSVTK